MADDGWNAVFVLMAAGNGIAAPDGFIFSAYLFKTVVSVSCDEVAQTMTLPLLC
jgi:hypothetical protein